MSLAILTREKTQALLIVGKCQGAELSLRWAGHGVAGRWGGTGREAACPRGGQAPLPGPGPRRMMDRYGRAGAPAGTGGDMQRQVCRALAALGVLAAVVLTLGAGSAVPRALPAQARTAAPARTVVTFTWGGGLGDQMGALPVFRRYRMHATFYVPSGLVCQPGTGPGCQHQPYLTLAGIRQIAGDGNEIGGLSVQHVPLTGMPAAEARREICDDRLTLTRWGFRVTD